LRLETLHDDVGVKRRGHKEGQERWGQRRRQGVFACIPEEREFRGPLALESESGEVGEVFVRAWRQRGRSEG
jgi:hypothetical protein